VRYFIIKRKRLFHHKEVARERHEKAVKKKKFPGRRNHRDSGLSAELDEKRAVETLLAKRSDCERGISRAHSCE